VDGDILAFASTTRADPEATMVPLPRKVHYLNLNTNEQWRLHSDTHWFGCQEGLAVDGEHLVFETRNPETGFSNIMLYNVRTQERTFIDPQKAAQYTPRVSGNKVVWTDGRNEDPPSAYLSPKNGDIYIYDIDTKKSAPVETESSK
ncbi:MAG: hypothetical protein JRH20_23770, partial [Deltaproteobacteria bacterium]|nr:hypothetical protein [Deltaproteobacteria bacterium]